MAVNMIKGQKISLAKESGGALSKVTMGLGWDPVKAKKKGILGSLFGGAQNTSIDLDASCALFDENKVSQDFVWFSQLKSRDGSIVHTGDNLTGDGEGDDEQIIVDLNKVPANIKYLVFTVNSFRGQTFNEVENAYCRLVDNATKKEVARYALSGGGDFTAMIMAKLYRHEGEWKLHALGEPANGQVVQELLPKIAAAL
jgi:tellurium resistance protein TerZ